MDMPAQATELHCSQCSGILHPDEGQIFLTCPYCTATVFIDKSQVVFHWFLAATLGQEQARAELMRWMASNQTVKDLDKKATLTGSSFEYFPMWYFKYQDQGKRERISLAPAAAISITEINHLILPAGDLRKYDGSIDQQARQPTVPLDTALSWQESERASGEAISEQALVHVPLFTFKYIYKNNPYTALVEGGTGGVFANIFPAKSETPYRTLGCATAIIFLILAFIPLGFSISRGWGGTGAGMLICAGLGLVFIPILFAIAFVIASKV